MIIHPEPQGSVDWMIRRSGLPTASEFKNIITDGLEMRTGEMPQSYLSKKLAEWWEGGPLTEFNTFDMDQGKVLEEEAIPFFEFHTEKTVKRVGLITTDDGKAGCSPDGLIEDDFGIEAKCPRIDTHIGYLLKGTVPKEYLPQIHGSMYVTGLNRWVFMSYRRRLPPLLIDVHRDEESQANIKEALETFQFKFEESKKRLCELNGGPPKRPVQTKTTTITKPEYVDIIP